jgi:hypothetical protein
VPNACRESGLDKDVRKLLISLPAYIRPQPNPIFEIVTVDPATLTRSIIGVFSKKEARRAVKARAVKVMLA